MKSQRNRLILAIALGVVIVLVLAGLLIYPQFGKLRDLDEQIVQAQSQIDQARALLEQRQAIKAEASQTEAALLRMSNGLPASPELPSFIIELQDTANAAGVDFRTLTPLEPEQRTGYAAILLNMEVNGQWADAIDFMQRLNKLTRQVRIVGYTASPVDVPTGEADEDTVQRVRLTFDVEVYTLAAADTATPPTTPPAPAQ